MVYSVIIGVYFFLMGVGLVGMSVGFNVFCMVIFLCICSLWVMIVFIFLMLIFGLGKL